MRRCSQDEAYNVTSFPDNHINGSELCRALRCVELVRASKRESRDRGSILGASSYLGMLYRSTSRTFKHTSTSMAFNLMPYIYYLVWKGIWS